MTPAEFTIAVQSAIEEFAGDVEAQHGATDDLMEVVLTGLGYGEGVELIRKTTRWYA